MHPIQLKFHHTVWQSLLKPKEIDMKKEIVIIANDKNLARNMSLPHSSSSFKVFAEFDRKPIEDLDDREKADPETETAIPSKLRHEVDPSHL